MTLISDASVPIRRAWAAAGIVWLGSVATLTVWLLRTPTGHLREQLKVWQFWSLEACVLLAVVFGVFIARTLVREITRHDAWRMAVLAIVAVTLTLFVAPRTNRIYYDEQIYQGIGQNLADLRLAQVCNDGSVEYGRLRCASGEYNKQPYAYPHVLGLAYRVFGVRAGSAFAVNAAAMGLTVCALYLLVCVLFRDRDAALFAGLIIALTPQQLIWSATAAVEPTASLALVTAVLCAAHYLRAGGRAALGATAVASAFAVQFRPESLLILPVVAALTWPRLKLDLERPRGWWASILFLWLVAVHIAHTFAIRHVDWGTSAARFSLDYVAANFRVNGWFYLTDERFPVIFTLLAIAGVVPASERRERLSMAFWFLLLFGITLTFYAGSYNYGADVRYSVMTYPPVAVLGGLGAAALARGVMRSGAGVPACTLIASLLAFQFLWYAPAVRATTEEAWAARADVRFAQEFARKLPRNSYVLTHNPGMFHLWGVNAGQMSLAVTTPDYVKLLQRRYSGGVYLHWNFWCNAHDSVQQDICRNALAAWPADIAAEYREREQRYAFHRLKPVTSP